MPAPLAVCLENLDARAPAERYLRCVAAVGRQPGLRVDREGTVLWRSEEAVACELWVSLDDKLILYRPDGAVPVQVRRAGRTLEAPEGKPVVLLDQDEFAVGLRRLRVHVHGAAPAVVGPSPLPVAERSAGSGLRTTAAAVALGAVLGAAGCGGGTTGGTARPEPPPGREDAGSALGDPDEGVQDIEVRIAPPTVAPMPPPPPPPPPEPIEVRQNPPGAPATMMDEVPPVEE